MSKLLIQGIDQIYSIYLMNFMLYMWKNSKCNMREKWILFNKESESDSIKFTNFLTNDFSYMHENIKEKVKKLQELQQTFSERIRDSSNLLSTEEREQLEMNIETTESGLKVFVLLTKVIIKAISTLSEAYYSIFLHEEILQYFAFSLNFYLNNLMLEKSIFKSPQFERFGFNYKETIVSIVEIYSSFYECDIFIKQVAGDKHAYSPELFHEVILYFRTNFIDHYTLSNFKKLVDKCFLNYQSILREEDLYQDAPDEFLDALTSNLMSEPMILPSGNVVDMTVIKKSLLNDPIDPFTRLPCSLEMLKSHTELKNKIEDYKQRKQKEKLNNPK